MIGFEMSSLPHHFLIEAAKMSSAVAAIDGPVACSHAVPNRYAEARVM